MEGIGHQDTRTSQHHRDDRRPPSFPTEFDAASVSPQTTSSNNGGQSTCSLKPRRDRRYLDNFIESMSKAQGVPVHLCTPPPYHLEDAATPPPCEQAGTKRKRSGDVEYIDEVYVEEFMDKLGVPEDLDAEIPNNEDGLVKPVQSLPFRPAPKNPPSQN
ncbi:hypothetical protein ACA910_021982 [Epithemia clementina (nom. ined.)]